MSEPIAVSAEIQTAASKAEAFAIHLESACDDFEILMDLMRGNLCVAPPQKDQSVTVLSARVRRAPKRVKSVLAMSFVFNARRANRLCKLHAGALALDKTSRRHFQSVTDKLTSIRNVNEHGYDGAPGGPKPSLHLNEGGKLDETSLAFVAADKILIGPLNLYEIFIEVEAMRKVAGFNSLPPLFPSMNINTP